MKTTTRIATSLAAVAVALSALTACSPQTATPTRTDAATSAPTAAPTPTKEAETPTATPAPDASGPTQEQAEALKADVVLTVPAGSNSAAHNGVTYDCSDNANAPVFDGAPLNASTINLQLDSAGTVISHECFYALTDEQLFG